MKLQPAIGILAAVQAAFLAITLLLPSSSLAFTTRRPTKTIRRLLATTEGTIDDAVDAQVVSEAMRLKDELLDLATATERGFKASRDQRQRAKEIVKDLSKMNPTEEPARSYYNDGGTSSATGTSVADLAGKWTLVYTDAPDITSLDAGPFSTARLGRIGQECAPPYIKNVIEWNKPDFAKSLPFTGSDDARVLQKVVCEASATPTEPMTVDLKLVGLDIVGDRGDSDAEDGGSIISRIQAGPAGLIGNTPFELRGFLKAPFGKFTVKYLDDEMRIIETYQGYLAINCRQLPGEEWFQ